MKEELDETQRNDLIEYRLSRSEETLVEADYNAAGEYYNTAVKDLVKGKIGKFQQLININLRTAIAIFESAHQSLWNPITPSSRFQILMIYGISCIRNQSFSFPIVNVLSLDEALKYV